MNDESDAETVHELVPADLQLDTENPRFAGELGEKPSQEGILDFIAETIGISDLLSSMSKRGYHRANPLIAVKEGSSYTVVEGNRRLATALILVDDERATKQKSRARNYPLTDTARRKLEKLPVLIAPSRQEILPYLGIAHIVGNKKWDSYAKAAWAADVLDKKVYIGGLREIAEEIGDKHRTLERMVEAFRMIKQLEASGRFIPDDTLRTGKGIAKFPFSWVYTALGYKSIRDWLGIDSAETKDGAAHSRTNIIPDEGLDRAGELLDWLFGSHTRGEKPRIEDSRQISDVAASVLSEKRVALLKRGLDIEDVQKESQPLHERIMDGLVDVERSLREILGLVGSGGGSISASQIQSIITESQTVAKAAVSLNRQLRTLAEPEFDEQFT
jgi:hypothetical protein